MVDREAKQLEKRDRKFAFSNFRTLSTAHSKSAHEASTAISKLCSMMQDVMTPKVGKIFTRQVEVAYLCGMNMESKWSQCTNKNCQLCVDDMTDLQKSALHGHGKVLVFHMVLRADTDALNDDTIAQRYASLGEDWDDLLETIPRMKYTRIITAVELESGEFLFMCSCGFDFRYQGTCRHISTLLLHASDSECAGCEIGNIALRNTAAYAACRDAALIRRAAFDWKGVVCGHVTEESLRKCPCPCDEGDDDDENNDDERDDGNDIGRKPARKTAEELQLKEKRGARMTEIQDHFYRVKAKLDSCKDAEFWARAEKVDGHILVAFQELGCVPDVPQSTVAHRYHSDAKRGRQPQAKNPAPSQAKRPAQELQGGGGAAAVATTTSASLYAVIDISDSDELLELLNGGAPSSSDE